METTVPSAVVSFFTRKTKDQEVENLNQEIFQQKLKDLVTLANTNHKQLHQQVARQFFQEDAITDQQLNLVLEYLRSQGIQVIGLPESENADAFHPAPSNTSTPQESTPLAPDKEAGATPLSDEDVQALEEYRSHFASLPQPSSDELSGLFQAAGRKDPDALQRLTEVFLPMVVELSAQYPGDISLQDKIQEGSLGLWAALEAGLPNCNQEAYLRDAVSQSISQLIQAESQQKVQDGYLVERVRSLESKVRELTEDSEVKFSVEELSAFLDMEVEEIKSILKLTGED